VSLEGDLKIEIVEILWEGGTEEEHLKMRESIDKTLQKFQNAVNLEKL